MFGNYHLNMRDHPLGNTLLQLNCLLRHYNLFFDILFH